MNVSHEPLYFFHQSDMFNRSRLCKVFELTDAHQSGDTPHIHDYTQMWYVSRGCCRHIVEDREYEMTRGDVFLLPPNVTHTTILRKDSSIICCEFSLDQVFPSTGDHPFRQVKETALSLSFIQLFMQETSELKSCMRLSPETGEQLERLMRKMLTEYNNAQLYYEDYLYIIIQEVLLLLVREFMLSPSHESTAAVYERYKAMVEAGVRYVDEHYTEAITLEDVCRVSMISKTYFCYLFKLLTQMTFKEYMMTLRIKKAVSLLEDPRNSITYISGAVGFTDSTHFSRTFKKMMGVSPRFYRTVREREAEK